MTFLKILIRRLQGERRGMGSELIPPTPRQLATLEPDFLFAPTIVIHMIVLLADVSFWQGVIDFVKMLAAGLSGVIIRAGQNTWEDIKFKINWSLAKAAGIARGSYFFYDSRIDPGRQAELWWSLIKDDTGELVHVADFEESYGGAFGKREHFKTFLQRFQTLSGLPNDRIAIYTGFFWWVERVGDDPWFKRYQLWLASYGTMSAARIPAPWTDEDLLFWQYTASGDGPFFGVSSQEIDLNWYCCDVAAYGKRFPLASHPPQGEPMPETNYIYSITPTGTRGSSVRPEPDTGSTPLPNGLPYRAYAYGNRRVTIAEDKYETINGVRTQVNQAGDIWLEVLEVNGTVLDRPAYIAEIHIGTRYATITQIGTLPAPPPPPGEEIVITQTFQAEGYSIASTVDGNKVITTLKPQ